VAVAAEELFDPVVRVWPAVDEIGEEVSDGVRVAGPGDRVGEGK
jgi:hypothetical protein